MCDSAVVQTETAQVWALRMKYCCGRIETRRLSVALELQHGDRAALGLLLPLAVLTEHRPQEPESRLKQLGDLSAAEDRQPLRVPTLSAAPELLPPSKFA